MIQRRRQKAEAEAVVLVRKILVWATCTIALVGLLTGYVHVFISSRVFDLTHPNKTPTVTKNSSAVKRWKKDVTPPYLLKQQSPPHLFKAPFSFPKFNGATQNVDSETLWKQPDIARDFEPCIYPSSNYTAPDKSRGYLLVRTNGGLNQMRAAICDMVAIARMINATLVVPELDKRSFWHDTSTFSDVFDVEHFIKALANHVRVVRKLPKEVASSTKLVKYFKSLSGFEYYRDVIATMWEEYRVIRAAKSDSRLGNNKLPPDIQKLRCRACYEALRFAPRIEAMGKLLVDRMRSYGHFIALHLLYEKDMLAFSGCTHGLSNAEAKELEKIRENSADWKDKKVDAEVQRSNGRCPLTPKEVGIFLTGLGYPSSTPIYIAAGDIYGGDTHMADLRSRYPIIMTKEKLASDEELKPFTNHATQLAALDYIVSVQSDVFISSYPGNMASAVEGHRRFLGHRKTISPDRRALVRVFQKIEKGILKEGEKVSDWIIETHKNLQGSPRKRHGPAPGTKGMDRLLSEEVFYTNPLPDCLCQRVSKNVNTSIRIG